MIKTVNGKKYIRIMAGDKNLCTGCDFYKMDRRHTFDCTGHEVGDLCMEKDADGREKIWKEIVDRNEN